MLLGWLGGAIRSVATGQGSSASTGSEDPSSGLPLGRHSLEQWLELWEKITRLFARVESANLDRKQVWVGAMLDIAGLASR